MDEVDVDAVELGAELIGRVQQRALVRANRTRRPNTQATI